MPCSDDHFHIFLSLKYTQALLYLYSQACAALVFLMHSHYGVLLLLYGQWRSAFFGNHGYETLRTALITTGALFPVLKTSLHNQCRFFRRFPRCATAVKIPSSNMLVALAVAHLIMSADCTINTICQSPTFCMQWAIHIRKKNLFGIIFLVL